MKNIKDLMPLGADDEMGRRKGEDVRTYNQKVILYKRALSVDKTESILKALVSAAELGHTKAMVALGRYYEKSDPALSEKWFAKAADEGNREAQKLLEKRAKAQKKKETPKKENIADKKPSESEIQAEKEKLKAKKKAEADKTLKSLLDYGYDDVMGRRRGEGVREYNKKVTLYKRALSLERPGSILSALIEAAEAGHTKAMVALGKYYKEFDPFESQKWLVKAVEGKNQEASELLKSSTDSAVEIDAELEYVLSAGKKYREIIDKKYRTVKDDPPYLKDFKRIAEQGNPYALLWLSRYYSSRNMVWSIDYLVSSCEKGYDVAIDQLFKDKGIESFSLSDQYIKLFLRLANINNCYVNYQLYRIYTDERYCQRYNLDITPEFAFELLINSNPPDNSNIKKAIYIELGKCYENGFGVEKSLRKARDYYKGYDDKKYAAITDYINAEARYNQVVTEEARKRENLISRHSNARFEEFKKKFSNRAASIEAVQRKLDPNVLKHQLEMRNKLLDMGYTVDQIYEVGIFVGDRIMKKISDSLDKEQATVKNTQVTAPKETPIEDDGDYERDPDPRIDFFNKISRKDKKQNVLLLPFVKTDNKPGGYGLISRYTYCPPLGQYEITHIYINGVLLNMVSEITPVSFSLKPGVYNMKVTARYVCTPDLDSDNLEGTTVYKNEKGNFDKTHTFECSFQVNENDTVRLAFRAYIIIEWEKEITEFSNNPQHRFDVMKYGDWKYQFYNLRPYSVSELLSISDEVHNWGVYSVKPFDPKVGSFEKIKRLSEQSYIR